VSEPGETQFCRVFKVFDGNGTYPSAVEHDGKLYVGFTSGGPKKNETPMIAAVPIASLAIPKPVSTP
jgi:hypothetical protein